MRLSQSDGESGPGSSCQEEDEESLYRRSQYSPEVGHNETMGVKSRQKEEKDENEADSIQLDKSSKKSHDEVNRQLYDDYDLKPESDSIYVEERNQNDLKTDEIVQQHDNTMEVAGRSNEEEDKE